MPAAQRNRPHVDVDLVEYMVVVVPDEAAAEVVLISAGSLERDGVVTILDAALVARDADGSTNVADPRVALGQSLNVAKRHGLLSDNDLRLIAQAVQPESLAVVIVTEDAWALPIADAARRVGGHIAGGERIPGDRLRAFLDAPPSTSAGAG